MKNKSDWAIDELKAFLFIQGFEQHALNPCDTYGVWCEFFGKKVPSMQRTNVVSVYLTSYSQVIPDRFAIQPGMVFINTCHDKFIRDWDCNIKLPLPNNELELRFVCFLIQSACDNPTLINEWFLGTGENGYEDMQLRSYPKLVSVNTPTE